MAVECKCTICAANVNPLMGIDNHSATSNNNYEVGTLPVDGLAVTFARPSLILPVPNVTAHPSTASVPITALLYSGPLLCVSGGCSGLVVEYRTRNRDVAGSTHTRSTASNLEQVANLNLLCAQANSASYPQRDGK